MWFTQWQSKSPNGTTRFFLQDLSGNFTVGVEGFTTAPDDARWYRFEYRELPAELATADASPAIPEPFHEAIVMYATWLHLIKKGERGDPYATKRDIGDLMENTMNTIEGQFDRVETGYGIMPRCNKKPSRTHYRLRQHRLATSYPP